MSDFFIRIAVNNGQGLPRFHLVPGFGQYLKTHSDINGLIFFASSRPQVQGGGPNSPGVNLLNPPSLVSNYFPLNCRLGQALWLIHQRGVSPLAINQLAEFGQSLTGRSEEHTSELQSRPHLVCRLLLEKKK